jgi:hypothetical protein
MNPRRLHKLTIFSILAAPELGEGGRCGSVFSLIKKGTTADYADGTDEEGENSRFKIIRVIRAIRG